MAAHLLLQMFERDVEGPVGVFAVAGCLQGRSGIEMGGTIGAEESAFMREHDIGIHATIEIFADCRFQTRPHLLGEHIPDIDTFA